MNKTSGTASEKSRQLMAIMFTDIVGYTAMMQQDEKKGINIRENIGIFSHHLLKNMEAGSLAGRKQNRIQAYETNKILYCLVILKSRIWDLSMLICLRRKSR